MLWFCSEPHHRSNQHSLMSDGLIKEEEEKDSWFSLCCWVYPRGKLMMCFQPFLNKCGINSALIFGNVGMAKMFAWWRGTGGSVCAGISQYQVRRLSGKRQRTNGITCHNIRTYQGLDESWVGVKSVLDGQQEPHGEGRRNGLEGQGVGPLHDLN